MDISKTRKDNQRLKQQLALAQDELRTIKGSKAFNTARVLGHAKDQFKNSPTKLVKKTVKRLMDGSIRSKSLATHKNLQSIDDTQNRFENWIILNEPDVTELEQQKITADTFKKKPVISIITPVFNPPIEVFKELLESVINQTYPYFELCLGNFGDDIGIKDLIKEYANRDSRIKSYIFSENKGIAENSNQILARATGEYIALLDHDDTISSNALFENVKLINQEDYDFIYSDKDKIDEQGNRFDPFFKPGWSPEIMLNANYLTHFNVMKTSIVKKVGAWDTTTDGAQDWDLFLKIVSEAKKIGHIQKILYHWRVIATSTALSIETKPYALKGQRNAVDYYLAKNNIPAKSYHVGAELLLDWREATNKTVCLVRASSNLNLRLFLQKVPKDRFKDIEFVFLYCFDLDENVGQDNKIKLFKYENGKFIDTVGLIAKKCGNKSLLFFDDRVDFNLTLKEVRDLTGWLEIDGVVAAGPRVVDENDYAIDCGSVLTTSGLKPIFNNSPPYFQSPIGNIEWVRDEVVANSLMFTANAKNIASSIKELREYDIDDDVSFIALQLQLSKNGRLVFNPKIKIRANKITSLNIIDMYERLDSFANSINIKDPYVNVNLSHDDPMQIIEIIQSDEDIEDTEVSSTYQIEASAHANMRTLTEEELRENIKQINRGGSKVLPTINKVIVFIPDFYGIYAGLNNIFSYADSLRKSGATLTFAIMANDKSFERQRRLISEKYPELGKTASFIVASKGSVGQLPVTDIAICTQWATAYILALYNKTARKCYFIQDKESSFYPKGTISALVENTYKFGFFGLANTPGLLDWYQKEYGGSGVVIKSKVDLSKYSPNKTYNVTPNKPYKVFFYARPNEPRNAFELGAAALTMLKKKLADDVEIYAAGADWNTADYGLEDIMINLGKIEYDKLPAFYRSMDAGLMFMFSGHPGVVASELMASGCPVVVNEYNDLTWDDLYQDSATCVVSLPVASEIAENIYKCLTNSSLRQTIINGGLNKVKDFYSGYQESIDAANKKLSKKIK